MQLIHQCEFCHTNYSPRPQVKTPRACPKQKCQIQRQRANECEWRRRHSCVFDPHYHRQQRKGRTDALNRISSQIIECVQVGSQFLGRAIDIEPFKKFLLLYLHRVGIRRVNKLCRFESSLNIMELESMAFT